ncbi:DUF4185 domain-containing protein [Occultella glacieicola]|uniref:DUF4185 domain-containing protein n=1 Tax=Occultella glacieicola TaxID=2518684 RepID=A0ABY2E7B9_9MICO|nr:DUF4185 domain-containing protein [Occultella glacieicola]TDE96072.1 DUF4185 domain-containing protein [Occultella glacieicola]
MRPPTSSAVRARTGRRGPAATAAVGLGLSALLLGALPAQADGGPGGGGDAGCSLDRVAIDPSAQVHEGLTDAFTTYGDSGEGWTGGDSTYSVPLDGRRTAWIFSDTFLGPVNPDGSRPESTPFLNNSFVIEDRGALSTASGGTPEAPESLIPPPPEGGGWYWVGDGATDGDGNLQLVALRFWYGGGGAFDFGWESNHLATFDSDTFERLDFVDLPSAAGVQWASWLQRDGRHTYIYGVEDLGASKYLHVARVVGRDLDGAPWEYWDGTGWSATETDTARVMDGVANEYSVTPLRDGYLLITQDTHEIFSSKIEAYVSCSPTGPFTPLGTVYQMPEVGAAGSYGDPNIFAYNAHEHPELRTRGDRIVVTYNVNSFDSSDLYEDVTIYRPRFVEIDLGLRPDCGRGLGRCG